MQINPLNTTGNFGRRAIMIFGGWKHGGPTSSSTSSINALLCYNPTLSSSYLEKRLSCHSVNDDLLGLNTEEPRESKITQRPSDSGFAEPWLQRQLQPPYPTREVKGSRTSWRSTVLPLSYLYTGTGRPKKAPLAERRCHTF